MPPVIVFLLVVVKCQAVVLLDKELLDSATQRYDWRHRLTGRVSCRLSHSTIIPSSAARRGSPRIEIATFTQVGIGAMEARPVLAQQGNYAPAAIPPLDM